MSEFENITTKFENEMSPTKTFKSLNIVLIN